MDLKNTKYENCQKNLHNKCKFCGKDLKPIGLDYLYTNVSSELIEYERCACKESKDYWKDVDFRIQEQKKKEHYREMINKLPRGKPSNILQIFASCYCKSEVFACLPYSNIFI